MDTNVPFRNGVGQNLITMLRCKPGLSNGKDIKIRSEKMVVDNVRF
jgi:hypothetical protein